MCKTMSVIGKVLIWLIFPFVVGLVGAVICANVIPPNAAGLTRFAYGVIVAAAFCIPALLCRIWGNICDKAWGETEEPTESINPQDAVIVHSWTCAKCNTENSINHGQCKKCGTFRTSI